MTHTTFSTARETAFFHEKIGPMIFLLLPEKDQLTARQVCKKWKEIIEKEMPAIDRLKKEALQGEYHYSLCSNEYNKAYMGNFNDIFYIDDEQPA